MVYASPSCLRCFLAGVCSFFTSAILLGTAHSALTVWVDLDSNWETRANAAATSAGVSTWSAGEMTTIEANILSELQRIYAGTTITFDTASTDPGGNRNRLYFGEPAPKPGALGVAPLYLLAHRYHSDFGASTAANVFPSSFSFIIESGDSRATQIEEFSTAIAGTAAHELGHSLGLLHNHAYAADGITPANYNATGGLQNNAIMATGSTGLNEAGRETQRELGPWEQVLMDVAGGGVFGGPTLVTTPVTETVEMVDSGSTAATATELVYRKGQFSGKYISHLRGALSSATDIDYYSLTVTSDGYLTSEVMSIYLYGDSFDSILSVYDTDGVTLLGQNVDASYNGNNYDVGEATGGNPPYGIDDPFLPNVYLPAAGTYYVAITVESDGAIGDDYTFVTSFDGTMAIVPEPGTFFLIAGSSFLILLRRRSMIHDERV